MTNTTHSVHASSRPTQIVVPGPWLRVNGRRLAWFHVCGVAAALSWAGVLLVGAELRALPVMPLLIISTTAAATFIALVLATALIQGEGRLTWYHHHLAVLSTTGIVMVIAHWPVLAYLDLVGTALMAFSAFGRFGCLFAGCCHGRPARSGVIYRSRHADAGLSPILIGVPLRPVQLMESMIAAALTTWCLLTLSTTAPAGTAFGLSLAGYALARFWLESNRGDHRPHAAGLSEAQWTATGTATALLLIALTGAPWLPPITALLAAAVVLSATARGIRASRA